jgi:hypothetical protein
MPVIGRLQLVLDHHLLIAVGAEDVELEVTHLVLGGDELQLTDAQGFGQRLQVVVLGQPGGEVTGSCFQASRTGTRSSLLRGGMVVILQREPAPAEPRHRSGRREGGGVGGHGCGGDLIRISQAK